MDAKNKLIDLAKKVCLTDSAIATRLNVSRQMLSHWRRNDSPMPHDKIVSLAKIAHETPEKWLVLIAAEQSTGDTRRAWNKAAERLGIAASLIVLLGSFAPPADASRAHHHPEQSGIYALCELTRRLILKVRKTLTTKAGTWNAARSTNDATSPMLA